MSRQISRAENWEQVYTAFQNINFSAFDYDSVKSSLVEYIKLYFPENFNDYIESSELIAILELFAYAAELIAYRVDMNAHENFISTAQRKQSILRLAKLLSYNASRNLPARGLVKLDSIKTTEAVFDSKGINLANKKITWNDSNNQDWKEHFFLVMNRVLEQEFGSVSPNDRVQVDDVLFELYSINNNNFQNGVIPYSATSSGTNYPMELVPSALNERGPYERRPSKQTKFTLLYGSDGLGDASDTTGFFCFTKQGTLRNVRHEYDGVTSNQFTNITDININQTDVWLNQVDPTTGKTIVDLDVDPLDRKLGPKGEWIPVSGGNAENIIFNTEIRRNKYEIETLEDDAIRLIFGDGEFADIPSGSFDVWYRQSANVDLVIPKNSISGQQNSFTYLDSTNTNHTFSFTYSLISQLSNAAASESIDRIRRNAPAVYHSQGRMVSGQDYNTYMLRDQSILKLRAINRTFSGDSKYIAWHDPSNFYEDVKMFGDDLVLFFETTTISYPIPSTDLISAVILDSIQPHLTDIGVLTYHAENNIPPPRREFTLTERSNLSALYSSFLANGTLPMLITYDVNVAGTGYEWTAYTELTIPLNVHPTFILNRDTTNAAWEFETYSTKAICESITTKFWFNNNDLNVLSNDTLSTNNDEIVILKANPNALNNNIQNADVRIDVIGGEIIDDEEGLAQNNINRLHVSSKDLNNDAIPDDLTLSEVLDHKFVANHPGGFHIEDLDFSYTIGFDEVIVQLYHIPSGTRYTPEKYVDYQEVESDGITRIETFTQEEPLAQSMLQSSKVWLASTIDGNPGSEYEVTYVYRNYAYYRKVTENDPLSDFYFDFEGKSIDWYNEYKNNQSPSDPNTKRAHGRVGLNFAWFHRTPRGNLVDPSPTNIIDTYVVSSGYYKSIKDWVEFRSPRPIEPTPFQLRTDYNYLLTSSMMSDTVILHPGKFKVLFGQYASPELRAKFIIKRSQNGRKIDNEVKVEIVKAIRDFFDINSWEFGESFYFSELSASIHAKLVNEIDSIILVPTLSTHKFGDLYQVIPQEDELFVPCVSVQDIEVVETFNSQNMKQ